MFQNLDPLAVALLAFAVVGVIELIKRLFDKDFRTAVIIAGSAAAGALFSHFAGGNLTAFQGMLIGLQASGLITVVSHMGSNQPAEPAPPSVL